MDVHICSLAFRPGWCGASLSYDSFCSGYCGLESSLRCSIPKKSGDPDSKLW
jgi:hypothetical protein